MEEDLSKKIWQVIDYLLVLVRLLSGGKKWTKKGIKMELEIFGEPVQVTGEMCAQWEARIKGLSNHQFIAILGSSTLA